MEISDIPATRPVMHILFCADTQYFQHMAVAAVSVVTTNPDRQIAIHVITTSQDFISIKMLRDTLAQFPLVRLAVHRIASQRLDHLFIDRHLARDCYLRFLAPEVLACDRVLYLDCDLVAIASLDALWATDLGEKSTGAAPDFAWDSNGNEPAHLPALGLAAGVTYVNSGVLLMDLNKWRSRNIGARLLDFSRRHQAALKFHDQDALNVVLQQDIHLIDCRWNLQARMYRLGRRAFPLEYAQTKAARKQPAILHYSSARKPWLFRTRCPQKRHYHRYLAYTAWSGQRPELTGLLQRIEYAFDRAIAAMGYDYMAIGDQIERVSRLVSKLNVPKKRLFNRLSSVLSTQGKDRS